VIKKANRTSSEVSLSKEEAKFPSCSGEVFARARKAMLASGRSVLIAKQGVIYERFPDGTSKVFKEIAAPIKVTRGTKFKLK
jgi:hypothetical protein